MPNIFEFNIGSDFLAKASAAIEEFIMEQEKPLRIALSGGSSPKEVYEKLANSVKIDWSKVELYQVDERSDHSNAKMIQEALISKLPKLKAFYEFGQNYESRINDLNRPLFDLIILGLGSDGHTASLFPHGPELEEVERLVVESESPSGIKERMTLSFPAIISSQKIIFLIRGANKREIVKKWLSEEGTEEEIPAKVILDHPDVDIYYDYST